ncbi:MAG: DNA topoisomerase IV subunit A [Alphaproteobacteria bacterium]|nr:DNA topoisomerase IV subunit A [Alphaproteobacteria bacterium]
MAKAPVLVAANDILEKPFKDLLGERYLAYALSTITSRSLPDVRDGLKPVHRRLMHAMNELGLEPNLPPKKCARVVGDVIGKFHPHGDVAVYEALVRLAQDFSVRYPLISGQGNFGNVDGDNAAAMRYTEAKLTDVAQALLSGLNENAVDFRATYDGDGSEPIVLPAAFPNLLANGASGIAVGMATSIPPHNISEICDALRYLITTPNAGFDKLVSLMPGPDFPTGGVIVEPAENIKEAYRTGRGSIRMRATWIVEEQARGTWQIIIKEIPYQVPKGRLIEKIAELITNKKVPLLDDVRDESSDDIRIVLVPKSKNVEPAVLMESLFRTCELETRFSVNMNVLDGNGIPRVMNLRELLQAFLDHRQQVLIRRSKYRLDKIEARLELLAGYLIAYLNLDKVIKIIRENDEPKPILIKTFKLTDNQADAILNMRLRSLRKLEEMEIKGEEKSLSAEKAGLKKLLADEKLRWQTIDGEIAGIKERFGKKAGDKRRTKFDKAPELPDVPIEAMIEREAITIILSAKGWVRAMRGHTIDISTLQYKEGDEQGLILQAETTDKILLFASNGRFYTLGGDKLPRGRGYGEPVRLMLDLPNDADILTMTIYNPEHKFLVASNEGRGFIVKAEDVLAQTKNGKQILNVEAPERAVAYTTVQGDTVAVIGTNRKLLLFPLNEVPEMARGKGVILQKYKDGELSDVATFTFKEGLNCTNNGRNYAFSDLKEWRGERAQAGRLPPQGFPRSNKFKD